MRFLYEHEKMKNIFIFAKASCNWLIDLYEKFGGIIQGISPQGITKKIMFILLILEFVQRIIGCYLISKDNKFLEYAKN